MSLAPRLLLARREPIWTNALVCLGRGGRAVDARPFDGHTALVTGAGRRLGRVLALRLAALGCNLVLHANKSASDAFSVASKLQTRGVECHVLEADLDDPAQARLLVERAKKAAGRSINFLVNNASTFTPATVDGLEWDGLATDLRVNAWAPFELTRAFAKQTRRAGAVVHLLDTRIADYDWQHVGYHLSKRMLADMTRLQAVSLAPKIRVNAVAPGPILPPDGEAEAALERWGKHLPLRRTPSPDDVADAMLYLLGATGVTGQVLHVDGGRHLGRAVYGE